MQVKTLTSQLVMITLMVCLFLTIESVKEIFQQIFKEQQNALVNIASQDTTPVQTSLDKLTMEIKDNNHRLNNIMKETDDLSQLT